MWLLQVCRTLFDYGLNLGRMRVAGLRFDHAALACAFTVDWSKLHTGNPEMFQTYCGYVSTFYGDFNSAINRISSRCAEWWSSLVWSSHACVIVVRWSSHAYVIVVWSSSHPCVIVVRLCSHAGVIVVRLSAHACVIVVSFYIG